MMSFLSGQGEEEPKIEADRRGRRPTDSSTIAIGTGIFVVALAAVVGLAFDRPPPAADSVGASWHLRGALGVTAPRNGWG